MHRRSRVPCRHMHSVGVEKSGNIFLFGWVFVLIPDGVELNACRVASVGPGNVTSLLVFKKSYVSPMNSVLESAGKKGGFQSAAGYAHGFE